MKKLFAKKYNPTKVKSHLTMSRTRIKLLQNKTSDSIKVQKSQLVNLLKQEKDESARIKVENVIRQEFYMEALEILDSHCDLLLGQLKIISETTTCPSELKEAVHTVLYAVTHIEVKELEVVRRHLKRKYGSEFVESAVQNKDFHVNQRLVVKLTASLRVPEPHLSILYLKDLAEKNGIELGEQNATILHQLEIEKERLMQEQMQEQMHAEMQRQQQLQMNQMQPYKNNIHLHPQHNPDTKTELYPSLPRIDSVPSVPHYPDDLPQPEQPNHTVRISFTTPEFDFNVRPLPDDFYERTNGPSPASAVGNDFTTDNDLPDFDELQKRFAELKAK